jgi:hypothetical protein
MAGGSRIRNPAWFTVAAALVFVPILFFGAAIIDVLWYFIGTPGGDPASANAISRNVLGIGFGFLLFYFSYRWAERRLKKKRLQDVP